MARYAAKHAPLDDYAKDARLYALCDLVRETRNKKRWSLHDLEKRCDVHRSQISMFEQGIPRALSVRYLLNVLDALGLSLNAVPKDGVAQPARHELIVGTTGFSFTNFAGSLATQ